MNPLITANGTTLLNLTLAVCDYERWAVNGVQVVDWREPPAASLDEDVLRPVSRPFAVDGGLRLLGGNLGQSVIKVSAVDSAG